MTRLEKLSKNGSFMGFLASVISIVIGLLFGFVLLLCLNPARAGAGMVSLLTRGLSDFGNVLYRAAPLIMVGLSVSFAYKVGLFNIGTPGQYTFGGFLALVCALELQLPWWLCLLAAAAGGALWGLFPGLFKAKFNVNEVLTSIMFNWIGMNIVNFCVVNLPHMLATAWGSTASDRTANLADANIAAIIPHAGLDKLFNHPYMNISIFIGLLFAVGIWTVLERTVFGYELKACGLNRNAAIYAGINAPKNIIVSMVIAGALAGLGGGMFFLAGGGQYNVLQVIDSTGYDGITVALLANCNPAGVIFSAVFLSYLRLGGTAMQSQGFATEATEIVTSVIVYLAAFALLMRMAITKLMYRRKLKQEKMLHTTDGTKASEENSQNKEAEEK